jgi:hypothetical protein
MAFAKQDKEKSAKEPQDDFTKFLADKKALGIPALLSDVKWMLTDVPPAAANAVFDPTADGKRTLTLHTCLDVGTIAITPKMTNAEVLKKIHEAYSRPVTESEDEIAEMCGATAKTYAELKPNMFGAILRRPDGYELVFRDEFSTEPNAESNSQHNTAAAPPTANS